MSPKTPDELLYDSEAALRLVDCAISDLDAADQPVGPAAAWQPSPDVTDAVSPLGHAGRELARVLDSLRHSRALLVQSGHRQSPSRDLTSEQLAYATAVIENVEARLDAIARAFDGALHDAGRAPATLAESHAAAIPSDSGATSPRQTVGQASAGSPRPGTDRRS